jgi:hypothetical protein
LRGAIVVGGRAVNEFFIGLVSEDVEREAVVRFAEESADAIFGEAGAVAVEGDLMLLFGSFVLLGEPGFDVVTGNRRVQGWGFRVQWRRGGEGARGRWGVGAGEALVLVVGLEDDFEALEILGEVAGGGFVDGFVAAGALFVGDGSLLGLEMANGFAGDEVEAVMLELEIELGRGDRGGRGFGARGLGLGSGRRWWRGREGEGESGRCGRPEARPTEAASVDAANDLGDAALGEVVFFGELCLAETVDLVVEIDLEIAPGWGGEFARRRALRFEGCGHGSVEFWMLKGEW